MKTSFRWISGTALIILVAATGGGCAKNGQESAAAEPTTVERRVPVVLTPLAIRDFEERLVVQGDLEAETFIMAPAIIGGTLEAIYVDEGDTVVAGETRLFEVDALKLRKAVEIRTQDLALARCGQRESQANLDRATADFEKAELDYHRFERLVKQDAVTADAFEGQESRYKQTKAMLDYAQTLVEVAAERTRQAEAALAIAEKDLQDSTVYAPISGKVSMRLHEPGEMVEGGNPVFRIEDPSVLEVSFFLPAQSYPRVHEGKTRVRVQVYGIAVGERVVSYKSPTIHPKLRTFEVKCLIPDPPENVVPGAMADVEVVLAQRTGLGAPTDAIRLRGDRPVVFVVEEDTARMVEVEPGLETAGWVEVRGDGLAEGTAVVTMGQFLLKDGSPVTVQKEAN